MYIDIIHCIIQNFRGTKLLWLGHIVSVCGKTFAFASKQCPQVPKYFEICMKIFTVQAKEPWKFWPLNVLSYMVCSYVYFICSYVSMEYSVL